ncbi:MAG: hypothetical protein M3Y65_14190 [Pseudomonadota bacterium]|nr:hypothetical protein [Pseudomonadota bacterium]
MFDTEAEVDMLSGISAARSGRSTASTSKGNENGVFRGAPQVHARQLSRVSIGCESAGVRSAIISHCKYRSLEPLVELCNLEELTIATFPDNSLNFLERLPQLRHLAILHMPKVSDLGPLAGLRQLTTLSLSTLPSGPASTAATLT